MCNQKPDSRRPTDDPDCDLADAVEKTEERITSLREELDRAESQLARLKRRLTDTPSASAAAVSVSDSTRTSLAPTTSASKIALFRSLFRGRCDLFPKLWINQKKGTKGYAPACHNEWLRGICRKPKVKCGECPNQAFVPVTDKIVHGHLTGRHVLGVYPMLHDETCWFLAVDFDKRGWAEDIAAFRATCDEIGVSTAVETSRAGNGAHAWFFFSAPVSAAIARKMGCYLITETMARRHELSMASYDRLFPNQDTMPRGGFGNLIALPLQYEARQNGNTFLSTKNLLLTPINGPIWQRLLRSRRIGWNLLHRKHHKKAKLSAYG